MKEYGKVKEYNGYYGKITNEKGEDYLLIREQIIDEDSKLNKNDIVSFVPEEYYKDEVYEKIARLIRKMPNKMPNKEKK